MKRFNLILLTILQSITGWGQFTGNVESIVSDTLKIKFIEWIDVDNDSLLDLTVITKAPDSTFTILFYKNNNTFQFLHSSTLKTDFTQLSYTLTDFDLDNQIDFVVSALTINNDKFTGALVNKGDFQFEKSMMPLLPAHAEIIKLADLDLDGAKEIILSGGDIGNRVHIYKQVNSNWTVVNDSIALHAYDLILSDFDGDMFTDIFITGRDDSNAFHSTLFINNGNLSFKNLLTLNEIIDAKVAAADLNYDGSMDLFLSGKNSSGLPAASILMSNGMRGFLQHDAPASVISKQLFAGDLNSDGQIDINILGLTTSGQLTNEIKFSPNQILELPGSNVTQQRFGDADRDGDLDLVQVKGNALVFLENTVATKNDHPAKPSNPFALMIFNRLFAYWDKSIDDHTPDIALTYDIALRTEKGEVITGDYDLLNKKRMLVSSGNNGSHNFTLLKNISPGRFELYIQAVDNAYHAGSYGVCRGNGNDGSCSELITETIKTCGQEIVTLTVQQEAHWFSFADGYLGVFQQYPYTKSSTDTLFAYTPSEIPSCSSLKVFLIEHVNELVKRDSLTQYVCEGRELVFTVESKWKEITWSSSLHGILSHQPTINYTVTEPDIVLAELSDGSGCLIERKTKLVISKPELILSNENYQLLKGESVQINASGGETYQWEPGSGLNNSTIANPVATPATTTEYLVTAYDSLGCIDQGKVLIIVEETAFIPNLFTPNEDGKNDALKIYGLNQVRNFSFSIYNRNGSKVYATSNIQEVITSGWNGTVSGVLQPAGVYHWKVQGENSNGKPLLLNGKETGSVILIR